MMIKVPPDYTMTIEHVVERLRLQLDVTKEV